MSRALFPLICVLLLAGCASSQPFEAFTPYSEDDFRAWTGTGQASLKGQAFIRIPDGRLLTCAGSAVLLKPATGYNMEAEQGLFTGKGFPANYDKKANKFDRRTVCDGTGNFAFQGLPTQNWIIVTHLVWKEPSGIMFMSPNDTGGMLVQEIQLQVGDNKAILTNPDLAKDIDE